MKKPNAWFRYTAMLAVALLLALALALVGCSGCGEETVDPDNNKPGDTTVTEGPETGVYYFDAESGEYTIHLHSGNKFTLNDGVARVGTYTVSGETVSFTFTKESNGTATATLAGDVLTLTYGDKEIRFIKKTEYTVTFNANGGEGAPASVKVVNGRALSAVADPTKANYAFVGWYTDEALTTPYIFGSTPVTADTTLYAKWVEKAAGQLEYTVSFDGADVDDMTTVGGKLYNVSTPTKDGYTFGGWWISATEKADELTAVWTEDTVFTANTTLFAVWTKTEGEKLAAPLVSVNANGISWPTVDGASTYAVKITDPSGKVVLEKNVSSTTENFDFAVAGMYTVEVTAVSTNTANNSDVTVRCYNAKAIDRVSVFDVIDSTLIFNDVGADKYYITVVCGNENHNHSYVSNGTSTVYNFANCEMKEGGIEFTVTAVKNGYASSVSKTFVCEKKLDKVTDVAVNAATETLVWAPVNGATYYVVDVNGTVNYVNGTAYSLKGYTGALTVKVTPVSAGYLSEATEYTYEKATLAAPSNVVISGNVIKWDAVSGAKTYTVKINGKEFTANTNSLDVALVDAGIQNGQTVEISIKAVADGKESVYSDTVVAKSLAFDGELVYKNGTVSWTPVLGKGSYEIKINGGDAVTVSDANSYAVKFTKAGVNTVSVRFVGDVTTEWVTEEITVYAIIFDSRLGAGVEPVYVVKGDSIVLPAEVTRPGYSFNGWYNTPNAAAGNGALYNAPFYTANDDTVLYAEWKAESYKVIYNADSSVQGITNGDTVDVLFNDGFTLGVPTSDKGTFLGWFTGPDGSGIQIADAYGKSTGKYTTVGNLDVYPFFEIGAISYVEQADGTWGVTAGPNSFYVENIIIPETYKGIKVTKILENGFKNSPNLKTISVPNTVNLIGTGAFLGCYDLEAINVRVIEGSHDVIYSSYEGALIRDYLGTSYLEYYPIARKGDFTVPATVDSIRNKAFQYADYLENLTISKNVTYIADQAFFHCLALKNITFEEGGSADLVIEEGAFLDMRKLETIALPARMAEVDLSLFDECPKLKSLSVEAGGDVYGSKDGMLTNGEVNTILYTPITISGDITIPVGITAIGDGAFANRANITSVTVSNKVESIGANAFAGCNGIENVTFVGGRNTNLVISESAFENCAGIVDVTFTSLAKETALDSGTVVIGASAFKNCTKLTSVSYDSSANVIEIGASAFENCGKLAKIVIPATATTVGDSAFAGCARVTSVEIAEGGNDITFGNSVFANCSELKSISLPATVTKFDGSVFKGCDLIEEIIVAENNPALYAENGILYNKAKTEIMYYPTAKEIDFDKLPSTLTTIGAATFQNNYKVTNVTIPAGVTVIGDNAFDGCINLVEVKFAGNGNIDIGDYAFANCGKLASVKLPEAVTAIGAYTFYKTGITSIEIPATVGSIGEFAFAYTSLAEVVIPANVTTVKTGAFSNITSLKLATVEAGEKTLELGSSGDTKGVFESSGLQTAVLNRVSSIGDRAFRGIYSLATVTIPENSPLEYIGSRAFENGTGITGITLPEGLKEIGEYAFSSNTKITELTIPSTVELIKKNAFAYMSSLSKIEFAPNGEADLVLEEYLFNSCGALKSITLPKRVTDIASVTMVSSAEIPTIYTLFNGWGMTIASVNVEEGCENYSSVDGVLYANGDDGKPAVLLYCPVAYEGEVTVPNTVVEVAYHAFYNVKSVTKVTFEEIENWNGEATLVIGNFFEQDYSISSHSVFSSSSIVEINFPAHLKAIGSSALYYLNAADLKLNFNQKANPIHLGYQSIYSTAVKELALPKVGQMESSAIYYNSSLKTLTFGKGSTLTKISNMGIYNNRALEAFEIPASVTEIDNQGLGSNASLASITFEAGSQLKSIGNSAFSGSYISEFTFPEGIESIGSDIFSYCNQLAKVTLASNMSSIYANNGGNIFANASALAEIVVPANSTKLKVVDGVLYDYNQTILMLYPIGLNSEGVDFVVPETVTSIEARALASFKGNSIILPEGLVKIADYAFNSAKNVKTLEIPASVKTIGNYAFGDMLALESISFKTGSVLESIGHDAFFYCTSLKAISIPDTVKTIGYQAFRWASAMTEIDLPTGLTVLEACMFEQCGSLVDVVLPEGLQTIEYGAFYKCGALEKITIPASVTKLENDVAYGVFEGCTSLVEVKFADGSNVTDLGAATFRDASSLKEIVLPESVDGITNNMFLGCTGLESVTILSNVGVIPANAFSSCTSLKKVVLNDGIKEIGTGAFADCVSLEEINLPEELEIIGTNAFRNCAKLASVEIGSKVTTVGNYAFDGCAGLASVTFDDEIELTKLGDDPETECAIFRGTTSLKSITIPGSVSVIGASLFENSGLETIDIPESIKAISDKCFSGCASLTEVAVPESVKSIGNYAFEDCSALKNVDIAFGVESIGAAAFLNCVSLEKTNIPATVATLQGNPFVNCPKLADLGFDSSNTDFVFENGALFNSTKTAIIYYLPGNSAEVFEVPETVREFAAGAFYGSQLKSIKIPEGVKTLGDMLFMDSKKLETVEIASSVSSIGDKTFMGCTALKSFEIPALIESIGDYAFANCESLESFSFAERKTGCEIGSHLLDGCKKITSFEFPAQITSIGEYMFANTGIVSFVIPEHITNIDVEGVFAGAESLKTVTLPSGATGSIGNKFFYNCKSLESIELPAGITTIGEIGFVEDPMISGYITGLSSFVESAAFYGCESLKSIDLTNVHFIGDYAFYGCSGLEEIIFGGTVSAIGDYAFAGCSSLEIVDMRTIYEVWNNDWNYWGNADMGEYVFADCTSLKEFYYPQIFIDFIRDGFFAGCTELEYVSLYDVMQAILGAPFADMPEGSVIYSSYWTAMYIDQMWIHKYDYNIGGYVVYDEWIKNTKAVLVSSDGAIVHADGTYSEFLRGVENDGSVQLGYDTVIAADGSIEIYLEFFIKGAEYGREVEYPAGYSALPAGYVINADGSVNLPNGTVIPAAHPNFTGAGFALPAGVKLNWQGAITISMNITISADGVVTLPEGISELPEGMSVADGVVKFCDGTTLNADGSIVFTDGVKINGTTVTFPDGTSYEARTIYWCDGGKHVVMPDVTVG